MAFSFSLAVDLCKHRLLAVKRMVRNLPANHYLEMHKKHLPESQQGIRILAMTPVCHICGFSMAELILDNNWSIRACSATGFRHILNNPKLDSWGKTLHEM
jgi:hypothetical protein